jgi:rubrerythrin
MSSRSASAQAGEASVERPYPLSRKRAQDRYNHLAHHEERHLRIVQAWVSGREDENRRLESMVPRDEGAGNYPQDYSSKAFHDLL